jgi:hypothetical protein
MSKRLTDRERLLRKFQQMSDSEVEDVLDYVSLMERTNQRHSHRDTHRDQKARPNQLNSSMDDELLASLSGAYENRRALQVFEWEAARRKAEVRVGSLAH